MAPHEKLFRCQETVPSLTCAPWYSHAPALSAMNTGPAPPAGAGIRIVTGFWNTRPCGVNS
jgi:hypothetical protein